jgi:hypothetical protein
LALHSQHDIDRELRFFRRLGWRDEDLRVASCPPEHGQHVLHPAYRGQQIEDLES